MKIYFSKWCTRVAYFPAIASLNRITFFDNPAVEKNDFAAKNWLLSKKIRLSISKTWSDEIHIQKIYCELGSKMSKVVGAGGIGIAELYNFNTVAEISLL